MGMVEHCMAKEVLQQNHSKRKHRESWEDGVRDDGIMLLGTQASKSKTKDRESWRQCIEGVKAIFGL